ncbi:hypothetical protein [Paraglaciecola aestuariivivens]
MSRFAYQALMLWDNPNQFEDKALYNSVHSLLGLLIEQSMPISALNESQSELLHELVAGSLDALSQAVQHNQELEANNELLTMLGDLIQFSNQLSPSTQH